MSSQVTIDAAILDRMVRRVEMLEQLIHDMTCFIREGDARNGNIPIVHCDATIDELLRRSSELVGE